MSTATDLGTLGLDFIGLQGSGNGADAVDLGGTPAGVAGINDHRRLDRDFQTQPIVYLMSGFDTVALTRIQWLSYGTPTHDIAPSANPVINISAARIR